MPLINKIVAGAAVVGAVSAITKTLTNTGSVGNLNSLTPDLPTSNFLGNVPGPLNSIPGKTTDSGGQGKQGGNINVPKAKTMVGLAEEEVVEAEIKDKPLRNILQNYASVNYIWTLSVLSPNQINFPDETYKKGDIGTIIFKSASSDPENRVPLSAYSFTGDSKTTKFHNPEGKYDFFIDDVKITGVIGMDTQTKNTNSTQLSFTVFEPYSLGLFFQSLMEAARINDYENWVVMPVLLTLEWTGHYSPDMQFQDHIINKRHFPLRLANMEMKVTERGSQYSVSAFAWNESAYNDSVQLTKTKTKISGTTVQEMLQKGKGSLQQVLNDQLKEQAKNVGMKDPDKILIVFPTSTASAKDSGGGGNEDSSSPKGATSGGGGGGDVFKKVGVEQDGDNYIQKDNVNNIGKANMGFNDRRKTQAVFGTEKTTYDEKTKTFVRGNITINETEGIAEFPQGTSIPNIINEIISSSTYGVSALAPDGIDGKGFIDWYKIDSKYFLMASDGNIPTTGRNPIVTVYRIVPSKVHHSKFLKPDKKPEGVDEMKENTLKNYDYIYTGKNTDILDFKINYQNTFYTSTIIDGGVNDQDSRLRNKNATVATPTTPVKENQQQGASSNGSDKAKATREPDSAQVKNIAGGIYPEDQGTKITKQFMDAIFNGGDMVMVDMRILGDPFYLGDSGWGNYTAKGSSENELTADGTINYQRTEVFITVNFKNPTDIDGLVYNFPGSKAVQTISGLYRVNEVESDFTRGVFTQMLKLSRMMNQDLDGSGEKDLLVTPPDPKAERKLQETGGDRGTRGGA